MPGEMHYSKIIRSMKPVLNEGDYVFCSTKENPEIDIKDALCTFRENEGLSVILPKATAEQQHLKYTFIASWITLTVHSSLEAVGLTAAASKALADAKISCNVVAAYYHDHIFIARKDADRAMRVLEAVSNGRITF